MKWRRRNGRLQCVLLVAEVARWHYDDGHDAGTRIRCSVREECLRRREAVDVISEDGALIERFRIVSDADLS